MSFEFEYERMDARLDILIEEARGFSKILYLSCQACIKRAQTKISDEILTTKSGARATQTG